MVKVNVKVKGQNYDINIPETLKEIDVEYLADIAKDINIAENYSLIALVTKTTLAESILAVTKKKESMVGVIPMFIKTCNTAGNVFINGINKGDVVVIGAGSIEQAHHINIPSNNLSKDKILKMIFDDETPSTTKASKAQMDNMTNNTPVCFISFKLIPNIDIVGNYVNDVKHDSTLNAYIVKKSLLS